MNAKQRKKDRKLRELIRLGMEAKTVIGAAEGEKTAALTLAERIKAEKLTAEQAVQEALTEIGWLQGKLVEQRAEHVAEARKLREQHAGEVVKLEAEHARRVDGILQDAAAKNAKHLAETRALSKRIDDLGEQDVASLRRRLKAKTDEVNELRAMVSRARAAMNKAILLYQGGPTLQAVATELERARPAEQEDPPPAQP